MNSYQKALEERKQQHLFRTLPLLSRGIDFYSNDYLGLADCPNMHLAIENELEKAPNQNGATGSRLLSGNSKYAIQVEKKVADFHGSEDAIIYPSGYAANLGLISSLATKDTTLICDELIHASLIDGARMGKSRRVRFKHNDVTDLRKKLKEVTGQKVVIIESVYSMDGDMAPLNEICNTCNEHNACLIVDEAHAIGVFGKKGEGLVQHLGLENEVMARIMTFGKAPGIHGAAIVGPHWLKAYQINFSRSLIFSTAPPAHHFASISGMYTHLPKTAVERNQLAEVVNYFVSKRKQSEGQWLDSKSHIQSLIVPGNEQAMVVSSRLQNANINALPIRAPSVAVGAERIRFCLHAYNTKEEMDLLFDTLNSNE